MRIYSDSRSAYASINQQGIVKVKDKISSFPLTITATYQGQAAHTTVSLTTSPIKDFVISPQFINISKGLSEKLKATLIFESNDSLDVTSHSSLMWTTDDTEIATVVNGLVTGQAPGSTVINVSGLYNDESFSASIQVEVTPATVKTLQVSPADYFISNIETKQFTAKAYLTDLTEIDITVAPTISWTSSDDSIADVSHTGLVTAKEAGELAITAEFHGLRDTVALTVINSNIIDVVEAKIITDGPTPLPIGTHTNYAVELTSSTGEKSILRAASTFSYVSSDPAIASIHPETGLLQAHQVGGPITISMNGHINDVVASSTTLTISEATLIDLNLTPSSTQTRLGSPVKLDIIKTYSDGSKNNHLNDLTWFNSNPEVGSLDTENGIYTPLQTGTTVLTVVDSGTSSLSDESQIEVLEAALESFTIAFADPSSPLVVNEGKAMSATGLWSDGTTRDITYFVDWSVTSKNGSATITDKGILTTTSFEALTITAHLDGLEDQSLTTSAPSSIAAILVSKTNLKLQQHQSEALLVTDQNGQDISSLVSYVSSNDSIASVNSDGLVTANGLGAVTLTVSIGDLSEELQVRVITHISSCGRINSTKHNTDGACIKVTSSIDNSQLFTAMPSVTALEALDYPHQFVRFLTEQPWEGMQHVQYAGFRRFGGPLDASLYCDYLASVEFLEASDWRIPTKPELANLISTRGPLGTNFRWPYPGGRGYRYVESYTNTLHIESGQEFNNGAQRAAPVSCVSEVN